MLIKAMQILEDSTTEIIINTKYIEQVKTIDKFGRKDYHIIFNSGNEVYITQDSYKKISTIADNNFRSKVYYTKKEEKLINI